MQPARPNPDENHKPHDDRIDADRLAAVAHLATVEHLAEAESTMHRGRLLATTAAAEALPALVVADRQTDGRGRRGAGWWQAAGSLAITLVIDPAWLGWSTDAQRSPAASGWSLACGVALVEALQEAAPQVRGGLRWPNDVEVAGRKLAGILAERSPSGRVLFGIGVNTSGTAADAPEPLRSRLVTIPDLVGHALPRQQLMEAFLPRLWDLLARLVQEPTLLRERYMPLCTLQGSAVTFHHGDEVVEGVCLGIDLNGALLLETTAGPKAFHGGSLTPQSSQWRHSGS
ncbi:MAG: biotin--[acetyl-CoA-carboxylase] ligase [Pirellulales bacterium]|jgi:BirA family biotin operon repressor/biotin-[acetyl-CoA-carboxylase] ligase